MAKVSLVFYGVVGLALVTMAVLLALVSEVSGLTGHVDRFAARVFAWKSLSLGPLVVAGFAAAFAGVVAVIGILLHLLGAFIYNRIGDLWGGIGVELGPDTDRPPAESS